jgi:hypothetical protein
LQIEVEFFNPFESVAISPKLDSDALEADCALLAASVGLALHHIGAARFAINLLPPSIVAERAERAKIPVVAAGGVLFVAALALVALALKCETSVIEAQRDAVAAKVNTLKNFDRKVKAADDKLLAAQADADAVRKLLQARSVAVERVNAVRSSLMPGMWIEKWEEGRVTIRYWKDRIKLTGGKTAGESVVDKLKGKSVVQDGGVKILDMSSVGKEAQVEQFTVELKFK